MINIEEKDLQKIISDKSTKFHNTKFPLDTILALLVFIFTALTVNITNQNFFVKVIFIIILTLYSIYTIFSLIKFFKNKYTNQNFYQDIVKISQSDKVHNFSLIVIKNKKDYKYLLRYDSRWKCFLFNYKRTQENDEDSIKNYLTEIFNITDFSTMTIKTDDIEKYSYSSNEIKKYHHTFYFIEGDFSHIKNKKINGEKFKWFSINEMKENKNIMLKNKETVKFVEENF